MTSENLNSSDVKRRFGRCIGFTPSTWTELGYCFSPLHHKSAWAVFSDSPNMVRFRVDDREGCITAFRANGKDVDIMDNLLIELTSELLEFHCEQCEPPPLTNDEIALLSQINDSDNLVSIRRMITENSGR